MRRIWITLFTSLSVAAVLALSLATLDARLGGNDRVAPQVYAAGVSLSDLAENDAIAALHRYEQELLTAAPFVVAGRTVFLDPDSIGLSVDAGPVVQDAMAQRPSRGLIANLRDWLDGYTRIDLAVPIELDMDALDAVFDTWDATVVDDPAHDGGITIEGFVAYPDYPAPGTRIARHEAREVIAESLASTDRTPIELPLEPMPAALDEADVDAAVFEVNQLIDTGVRLLGWDESRKLIVTQQELLDALSTRIDEDSPTRLVVELDRETLRSYVDDPSYYDRPPVDASFRFSEQVQQVFIVPGSSGVGIDMDRVPDAIIRAARNGGTGILPLASGASPDFSTAQAEAMGPITKLSEFTTRYTCCQRRTINIRRIADQVDGALVWPGETWSVNGHVGKRTRAKGYVPAGAIIAGKLSCCDSPQNIGGGTSQFGTTIYNAIFYSCLEDVEHKPHSWYFSRYPFGLEATMGYPKPDVIFRNDTQSIVYIDTSYTGTSVTVAFYGNTDGRECSALVDRSGRTARVTRVITYPDGTFKREPFTWTYTHIA